MVLKSGSSFGVIHDEAHLARIDLFAIAGSIFNKYDKVNHSVSISVPCNGAGYTNYKTSYLHQCIVLKNLFYTLKPSTHIKINFNMCKRF